MKSWFIVLGQSGAGKTLACSIIANGFIRKAIETVYVVWGTWIKEIKNSAFGEDYNELFDYYENVEVLFIDDFLKGKYTEADLSYAFDLINSRYNQKLVTIISSERLLDEIVEIDEAIAGRLKQMSGDYLIQIGRDAKKNYRFKL